MIPTADCRVFWKSCAACVTRKPVARGISNKISPPSPPTRSRKPTRSPMPSNVATCRTCATNLAICCCKPSTTRKWPKNKGRLRFRMLSNPSRTRWSTATHMCLARSHAINLPNNKSPTGKRSKPRSVPQHPPAFWTGLRSASLP